MGLKVIKAISYLLISEYRFFYSWFSNIGWTYHSWALIWYVLFFIIKKKSFFKKKKTDWLQPDFFWIVTVQEWPKTTPVNTYCPLRTIDFSNVVDIDNFWVETQNKFCIF